MRVPLTVFIVISFLGWTQAWQNAISTGPKTLGSWNRVMTVEDNLESCGQCERSKCVSPTDCRAGVVLDRCGCCSVCGLEESHLCNLEHEIPSLQSGISARRWHGRCGYNLECRLRTDVDVSLVGLQSICYCTRPGLVCGSDGVFYSHCQLEAQQGSLKKMSDRHCEKAPKVEMIADGTVFRRGDNITLTCEARGYPTADITWYLSRPQDGNKRRHMPGDWEDITVSVRGGNSATHVTSHLQITNFKLEFEGTYHCLAKNEVGSSSAIAKLVLEG